MSNDTVELELGIQSHDETDVAKILEELGSVATRRLPPARVIDPVTIVGLAAAAAELVNALWELRQKLATRSDAPRVTVRNQEAAELDLRTATRVEIEVFVTGNG